MLLRFIFSLIIRMNAIDAHRSSLSRVKVNVHVFEFFWCYVDFGTAEYGCIWNSNKAARFLRLKVDGSLVQESWRILLHLPNCGKWIYVNTEQLADLIQRMKHLLERLSHRSFVVLVIFAHVLHTFVPGYIAIVFPRIYPLHLIRSWWLIKFCSLNWIYAIDRIDRGDRLVGR